MTYHSQKGQDKWVIEDMLPGRRDGFFVDIGASNGLVLSNTCTLEKELGWTGICVEPNPQWHTELHANRSCIISHAVINDSFDPVLWMNADVWGGIVADDTDNNYIVRGDTIRKMKVETRPSITIAKLLEMHEAPETIDYLSVDVEGAEDRVMRGFDFEHYKFLCGTFERVTPFLHKLLSNNGYRLVMFDEFESFYTHDSLGLACIEYVECEPRGY